MNPIDFLINWISAYMGIENIWDAPGYPIRSVKSLIASYTGDELFDISNKRHSLIFWVTMWPMIYVAANQISIGMELAVPFLLVIYLIDPEIFIQDSNNSP